eukprot:jgi/Chlat1/743/Chrsp104S01227
MHLTLALTPAALNWYGMETTVGVPHGLWSRDYKDILNDVKGLGFNSLRIPFSNEMWERNNIMSGGGVSGCWECQGKSQRDVLALILNYAGSIGMHVVLDNHRSTAGDNPQARLTNGLWYSVPDGYRESNWINDWVDIQSWMHGESVASPTLDTVSVNYLASDGYPTVIGFDLRNEPHPASTGNNKYLAGATWGTGDGISPGVNPNPNPFQPTCVAKSTCHDFRLAVERAGAKIFLAASKKGWDFPLLFVEGVGSYPSPKASQSIGPYYGTWWGANLRGVNGHDTAAGAPVVFNLGGDASKLGPPVYNKLVYAPHDYGPALFEQYYFNSQTCYKSGCGKFSLASEWRANWAYLAMPGGIKPTWPKGGGKPYPWGNTGHVAYDTAPVWVGEFGTRNTDTGYGDPLYPNPAKRGTQGQWFTDFVNFLASSGNRNAPNSPGFFLPVPLSWSYWPLNGDGAGVFAGDYRSLAVPAMTYSFLCYAQQGGAGAMGMGTGAGMCGSTGGMPAPM